MKKEKLLEMAREYGIDTGDNCTEFGERDLIDFANAILELAAQECKAIAAFLFSPTEAIGATACADKIESLIKE